MASDLATLLERLAEAGVDFILVGGLAAVTQGAPLTTMDVDIVHSLEAENVDRLMEVLEELGARHRLHDDRDLPPIREHITGGGHTLLITDLGPLDILCSIEGGKMYGDLLEQTIAVPFRGHRVRVLKLETLVALKRSSAHPKDRLQLSILEATLARLREAGE